VNPFEDFLGKRRDPLDDFIGARGRARLGSAPGQEDFQRAQGEAEEAQKRFGVHSHISTFCSAVPVVGAARMMEQPYGEVTVGLGVFSCSSAVTARST